MTSLQAESYLLITPITLATCHAVQNSNQQAPDATSFFSCWWDAYRKQLGLKDFSPKSQDAVALQQIKERGALPMIDRDPSGNRPLQQYLGFTAGRWLWSFEHKADSLIAKFKEAGGTVREIDV